jgi:hypothetical protein
VRYKDDYGWVIFRQRGRSDSVLYRGADYYALIYPGRLAKALKHNGNLLSDSVREIFNKIFSTSLASETRKLFHVSGENYTSFFK